MKVSHASYFSLLFVAAIHIGGGVACDHPAGRTGRIASRFGSDLAPVRPNAVLTPSVRTSHADGTPRASGPVRGPERHASTARPHTHDGFLAAGSAARDRALLWMRHTLRHTQRQLARHSHSWVPRTRPHHTAQHVMSGPAAPPAHPPTWRLNSRLTQPDHADDSIGRSGFERGG